MTKNSLILTYPTPFMQSLHNFISLVSLVSISFNFISFILNEYKDAIISDGRLFHITKYPKYLKEFWEKAPICKSKKCRIPKVYLANIFRPSNSRKFIQKSSRGFWLAKVSLVKISAIKVSSVVHILLDEINQPCVISIRLNMDFFLFVDFMSGYCWNV